MGHKDYSGTPLPMKLGIKEGSAVAFVGEPSSFRATDLSFQEVQTIGLEAGLVDNKSCSIDEEWQALRFVMRREDRPRT